MIRLRAVLKKYKRKHKDVAKALGITDDALRQRTKNPTIKSIKEIADEIGCDPHELIDTSPEYAHFYANDEWQGIRKL